jgi:tetratricopeptide (TPR) repeat protein
MFTSLNCPICRTSVPPSSTGEARCSNCSITFRIVVTQEATAQLSPSGVESDETGAFGGTLQGSGQERDRSRDDRAPENYDIEYELGRGGMGVVYLARQRKLNRPCALKMILAGGHAGQLERLRFETEARAMARLNHPHIVQVFEIGEHNGTAFMALELCTGGSLQKRLRDQPPTAREAAEIVRTLALAIEAAHDAHMIHRDLKPGNVLITADGTLKVTDFGLARMLEVGPGEESVSSGLTHTGSVIGTPSYMPPEQAAGKKDLGPAADIYALGAILYDCLTGRPPFKAATPMETVRQVLENEPVPVRQLNSAVPLDLETICHKCLQKDPAKRYATARELADDLERFLDGRPIQARPVGRLERAWRWCRRNPWWAGALGTVALLLVTIIGGLTYGTIALSALNADVSREAREKENQRREAVKAQDEAIKARNEVEEKVRLAEARLDQSVDALRLYTDKVRTFCEDALVPGKSKQALAEMLIEHLKKQPIIGENIAFDPDKARNAIYVYQNIALTQLELGPAATAEPAINEALKLCDEWIARRPDEPAARGYRAAVLHLFGVSHERRLNNVLALKYFTEAYEIRKSLVNNEKVERFTPGKTLMDLADSLESLKRFDECLATRKEAYDKVAAHFAKTKERADLAYMTLDSWCWTYQKAAFALDETKEFAKRKDYLEKSAEQSAQLEKLRAGGRPVQDRLRQTLRALGDMEFRAGAEADRANQPAEARSHFDAAKKTYTKLADVTRRLTTAEDLLKQRRELAASWCDLAWIEKHLGQKKLAREHFVISQQVYDEILRDYARGGFLFDETTLRTERLLPLLELGRHAEAVNEADRMRVKYAFKTFNYQIARVYSRCIAAVEEERLPADPTPEDRKLQDTYRDKALQCLEDAVRQGFDEWHEIRTNPDLDPLRGEAKFKKILAQQKQ